MLVKNIVLLRNQNFQVTNYHLIDKIIVVITNNY